MESNTVKLIENFVSWQGEGPDSGKTMIILRFKTCNLNCPWCDTSVKMRISAEAPYELQDIQSTINERNAGLLITGGEPTVPKHFDECVKLLTQLVYPVANVESNGYKLKELIERTSHQPIKFIYSPKIFSDGDLYAAMDLTKLLINNEKVHIKIVYQQNDNIDQYLAFLKQFKGAAWNHRIWLMPEGTNRSDLIRNAGPVFDMCEKYGFSFSSRAHIIFGFV